MAITKIVWVMRGLQIHQKTAIPAKLASVHFNLNRSPRQVMQQQSSIGTKLAAQQWMMVLKDSCTAGKIATSAHNTACIIRS